MILTRRANGSDASVVVTGNFTCGAACRYTIPSQTLRPLALRFLRNSITDIRRLSGLQLRQLEIACIDPHQTGSVGEGSDHLQLNNFFAVPCPREGVCSGAKFFGSALLQPARSVCVASERSFHYIMTAATAGVFVTGLCC